MSLKKFLERNRWTKQRARKGQSVIEYFILFTALALLTILASSSFFDDVKRSTDFCFNYSVGKMKQQDLDSFQLGGVAPGGSGDFTL
ncbi:MAG: hypothetical protein WC732_05805 [Candidatus Omnitrophota bacterium]